MIMNHFYLNLVIYNRLLKVSINGIIVRADTMNNGKWVLNQSVALLDS